MATASKAQSGITTFTTPSDLELVATRVFDAPRELVWEAFTKVEHLRQWVKGPNDEPMAVTESDTRPGGKWRYAWKQPEGGMMQMRGTYREVVEPERIVHVESWGDDWPETINTQVLTEQNGKTKVVTTIQYVSREARDRALATGMKDGWSKANENLDDYLPKMASASRSATR